MEFKISLQFLEVNCICETQKYVVSSLSFDTCSWSSGSSDFFSSVSFAAFPTLCSSSGLSHRVLASPLLSVTLCYTYLHVIPILCSQDQDKLIFIILEPPIVQVYGSATQVFEENAHSDTTYVDLYRLCVQVCLCIS